VILLRVVAADMESTDLRMAAIIEDVISVGAGVSNPLRCERAPIRLSISAGREEIPASAMRQILL
jgi:hypothetical protein